MNVFFLVSFPLALKSYLPFPMEKKAEVYKTIKIGGMIAFIPMLLLLGPLAGYFLGDFLRAKMGFHRNYVIVFIFLGFFSSVFETLRIVKRISAIEKKKD